MKELPDGIDRKQALLLVLLGVAIVVTPAFGVAVLDYQWEADSGITFEQTQGPDVELGTGLSTDTDNPYPDNHTVDLGSQGTFESNGDTYVRVDQWGSSDQWTQLSALDTSNATLYADLNGRERVGIQGDATAVSYADIAPDNGHVLTVEHATGGTSTITLSGFTDAGDVAVVNADTGSLVEIVSPSNGEITFTASGSTDYEFQTADSVDLSLANPDPIGGQSTSVNELAIDVQTDRDDINTDVEITHNGQTVHTETIQGDTRVTASTSQSQMGVNNWTVTATDELGNSVTEEYQFSVPDEIYVYNETAPSQLVTDASLEITFFGEDRVYTRTATDGVVSMDGLPADQEMTIQVEADNYTTRQTIIRSIHEQQSVYALPENAETVSTRFQLDDPTGRFSSENTRVLVQKPIERDGETVYETVVGDVFGTGEFSTILERDQRYKIEVENTETGEIRELGPYVATTSENVVLEVDQLEYNFEDEEIGYEWGAKYVNQSSGDSAIDFSFAAENGFENLEIEIVERQSGDVIYTDTVASGTEHQVRAPIPDSVDQPNATTYSIRWSATVTNDDGEQTDAEGSVVVGPDGQDLDPEGVPEQILELVAILVILLVAGLFSAVNVGIGGVVTSLVAGLFWFAGFLPGVVSGLMIGGALLLSVMWMARNARGPQ